MALTPLSSRTLRAATRISSRERSRRRCCRSARDAARALSADRTEVCFAMTLPGFLASFPTRGRFSCPLIDFFDRWSNNIAMVRGSRRPTADATDREPRDDRVEPGRSVVRHLRRRRDAHHPQGGEHVVADRGADDEGERRLPLPGGHPEDAVQPESGRRRSSRPTTGSIVSGASSRTTSRACPISSWRR